MKVLLVDDNEELREFLVQSLREASVDATATGQCETAVALADKEKFDAYIVDSLIDDIDGLSLVVQLRALKNGGKVPILLMSTLGTALARRMAQNVGCDEFLVKPFGPGQFVEQVRALEKIRRV